LREIETTGVALQEKFRQWETDACRQPDAGKVSPRYIIAAVRRTWKIWL